MTQPGAPGERRVQERRQQLKNAERVFDDYIASVARELRLPLRSILRLARMLGEHEGAVDAETRQYVDYIRASAEHMSVMLGNLRRPHGGGRRSTTARPPGETDGPF